MDFVRRQSLRGVGGAWPALLTAPISRCLYKVTGKFALVAGPVLVGAVVALSGDVRLGILMLVLVASAWLLSRVDVAAGERQAGAA